MEHRDNVLTLRVIASAPRVSEAILPPFPLETVSQPGWEGMSEEASS